MKDIRKVLVIGAGPVVIGTGCEYDYAAVTVCNVLREKGIYSILINPNPVTVSTGSGTADKVYCQPVTSENLKTIIETEGADAVFAATGGEKGLMTALELSYNGYLDDNGVTLLGADPDMLSIVTGRTEFSEFLKSNGLPAVEVSVAADKATAAEYAEKCGYPVFVSAAYTVGVSKKYLCAGKDELEVYADDLFRESSTGQIFVEKSVSDYKKVEFEVIRDNAGTCGAVCSMESMDSVGINSGDSIVVIPAQTVSPEKLDKLSTCACKAVSALKVTGNCCVSMAVSRTSDRYFVIGMRPGVSRTSVLATKAMGYPLNRISVQVMLGADFDTGSIPDISGRCSVRMPKWSFDSFELNSNVLDTSMQSTGEVLCTAPDFKAAFMKAIRSIDPSSTLPTLGILTQCSIEELNAKMKYAADDRVFAVYAAVKHGISEEKIYEYSHIDKWFLDAFAELAKTESNITHISSEDEYLSARASGFTDADIVFDGKRQAPSYKASMKRAPYYLTSVFDGSGDEIKDDAPAGKKVLLIGSGPTFVGNAAELDWCLVSTAAALRKRGYYVVLLNNDPSAVSTGTRYCDKLYFEPVTADDASEIADRERPDYAVTQFCGPQAYKMTEMLEKKGIKILGPDSGSMNILSDKVRFNEELDALDIRRRDCCFVTPAALSDTAYEMGFPVSIKTQFVPSVIAYNSADAAQAAEKLNDKKRILAEKYFAGIGLETYAVCNGNKCCCSQVLEHIEHAGVNSADSISVTPADPSVPASVIENVNVQTAKLCERLNLSGLICFEYVYFNNTLYLLSAKPGYVRGVPFTVRATGIDYIDLCVSYMLGEDVNKPETPCGKVSVRVPVFSFEKLPGADVRLDLGAKSTGEVMATADTFEKALLTGLTSAGMRIKRNGGVLITVRNEDKQEAIRIADMFSQLGFRIYATSGTANIFNSNFIATNAVRKIHEDGYTIKDLLLSGKVDYVISTPTKGRRYAADDTRIRRIAVQRRIPTFTSLDTAAALAKALKEI